MLFEQMAEAIGRAPIDALDDVTRALWAAVSAAQLSEADALRLSAALDARRLNSKAGQVAASSRLPLVRHLPSPRKHQRSPERSEALERRRRWAAAGRMPPAIACKFSSGEQAALAVIAFEISKRGTCTLAIGAIAALAGVSETTVRRALRQAKALSFVTVEERRLSHFRNETNVVSIISSAWTSWLRLGRQGGGCQSWKGMNTKVLNKGRSRPSERSQEAAGRLSCSQDSSQREARSVVRFA